jgi:pathogenesis-related protein 1
MAARRLLCALAVLGACGAGDIGQGSRVDGGGQGGGDGGQNGQVDGGGQTIIDAGPGNGSEPAELAGIVAAHNQVRASHGVGPLVWDQDLADIASTWAATCTDDDPPAGLLDHNDGRSNNYPEYVGENIYASSSPTPDPIGAVSSWASEESDYDYASNTCSGVCGHYTQIVWATSTKVGCAFHDCASLTYRGTIICNYAPGGNDGGRPY